MPTARRTTAAAAAAMAERVNGEVLIDAAEIVLGMGEKNLRVIYFPNHLSLK